LKLIVSQARFNEFFFLILFAVCPLLFFTDLTRNPYQIQITLLNLILVGFAWGECLYLFRHPEQPVHFGFSELAFLLLLAWAGVTWACAWLFLPPFRAAIANEGLKGWLLMGVNGCLAFRLGRSWEKRSPSAAPASFSWPLLSLALLWGILWLPFHQFHSPEHPLWDPYGFALWALLIILLLPWRKPNTLNGISIILCVSIVAGGYAVMEYFGTDVIWAGLLNPYGGRPVSTFGNPNFLSSYLVLGLPLALALALSAPKPTASTGYIVLFFLLGASLLCTLTRTSFVGASLGLLIFIVLSRESFDKRRWFIAGGLFCLVLLVIVLWPRSPVSGLAWSPLSRMKEFSTALKTDQTYQPMHQRFLIWRSAWNMLKTHPALGVGWGCFEMFFPFYQGPLVFDARFRSLRTHANNAHNLLLEFSSQMGLIGLGLFLWLMIFLFFLMVKERRRCPPTQKILVSAIAGGCAGVLLDNALGNVSLFFAAPAFSFWWLLGAAIGITESDVKLTLAPPLKRSIALALMVGGSFAAFHFLARFAGERFYFQGFKLSKENQPSQAVPFLERSMKAYALEVNNAYELGNCYAREAKILEQSAQTGLAHAKRVKVIGAYQTAIAANPGYDEIYYNLATILATEGRLAEAVKNLKMSLWINPLSRDSYKALCGLSFSSGLWRDETISELQNAVLLYPQDFDLRNSLGYLQMVTGRYDEALKTLERCVEINPRSEVAHTNFVNALRQLHRPFHPSVQVFELFKQLDQEVAEKRLKEASKTCETLLRILPDNPPVLLAQANLLALQGQPQEAIHWFQSAIHQDPSLMLAHLNLAKTYEFLGDRVAARAAYQQVLQLEPNQPEAQSALTRIPR